MSVLDPGTDRAVAARLTSVLDTLDPLLREPAPDHWEPGLRRRAVLSDLLRTLDESWPPNGPTTDDPWSVPNGTPEGADAWPTRTHAAAWLGLDRVACLRDLIPTTGYRPPADGTASPATRPDTPPRHHAPRARTHNPELSPLVDLLSAAPAGRPLALRARHWGPTDPHDPHRWLEIVATTSTHGPDGPRNILILNATWRRHDTLYVETPAQPGRDGLLLITPAGDIGPHGHPTIDALAGFVHLLPHTRPHAGTHAGTHAGLDLLVERWRSRLLETYRARARAGDTGRGW